MHAIKIADSHYGRAEIRWNIAQLGIEGHGLSW